MDGLSKRVRELAATNDPGLPEAVEELLSRVKAERVRLKREANVGRRMLEASRQGVVLVDDAGKISHLNPKAHKLLRPRGEVIGKTPIECVPLAELQEALDEAVEGEEVERLECRVGTRDLLISATALPGGGAMAMVRDVTREREAQRARTDFVANVSHELRTPVTAIMGYSETLLGEADRLPDDLRSMCEKVDRNARRLRDLFEDLLQLHRVESRRRELPLRKGVLRPILEEAVIGAADQALQRGSSFELRCDPGLQATFNPESLRTMVSNLCSNAVNYTNDGGSIQVIAEAVGNEVVVRVVDDGIGIAREHQQRIFERFYRVDAARSRRLGGTGLGLALVKHLALASRSRVSVESAINQGTTFRVHLPEDV